MPAKWRHLEAGNFPVTGQIQAVAAKKHVTIFSRSLSAPGAGSSEQKVKFSKCAKTTKGVTDRIERNSLMKACLK